jgi:hypothetical protein
MSTNRKKAPAFRPAKEQAEGFDWRVRSALQGAGFAVGGATKRVSERTSAIFGRPQGQKSIELVCANGREATRHEVTENLPDLSMGQPFPGVEFFALVGLFDASQVHYYGVDTGTGAFTVRCAADGAGTSFGHWNSMGSAFQRLDQFAGPNVHLGLVFYDSIPVMALSALGVHTPQVLDIPEVLAIKGSQ